MGTLQAWIQTPGMKIPGMSRLHGSVFLPSSQPLPPLHRASRHLLPALQVMYTVIQSLTADGRDRGLDYKLSGFHVPPASWDALVRCKQGFYVDLNRVFTKYNTVNVWCHMITASCLRPTGLPQESACIMSCPHAPASICQWAVCNPAEERKADWKGHKMTGARDMNEPHSSPRAGHPFQMVDCPPLSPAAAAKLSRPQHV